MAYQMKTQLTCLTLGLFVRRPDPFPWRLREGSPSHARSLSHLKLWGRRQASAGALLVPSVAGSAIGGLDGNSSVRLQIQYGSPLTAPQIMPYR